MSKTKFLLVVIEFDLNLTDAYLRISEGIFLEKHNKLPVHDLTEMWNMLRWSEIRIVNIKLWNKAIVVKIAQAG